MMMRRKGESILIGGDIEVRIISIGRTKVKFGIIAPREIPVVAREFQLVEKQNRAAASTIPGGLLSPAIARIARKSTAAPVNPPQSPDTSE
jgi:carbon storage regulator